MGAYQNELLQNYLHNKQFAKPEAYFTRLSPQQESQFRQWVKTNHVDFDANAKITDYDMRGFWLAQRMGGDPQTGVNPYDHNLHFTDEFKTPYDRDFSNQSRYAKPDAPHWVGNRYLETSGGKIVFDQKTQTEDSPWTPQEKQAMADTNPYAQFAQPQASQANPYAQWAVVPDDVVAAAGQNATRQQLSDAFYKAKQAGDEQTAMHIIGQIQRQGLTLAPMNAEQSDAAFQRGNDANVASMSPVQKFLAGAGKSFVDTGRGIGEAVGVETPQDVADARNADAALMRSGLGEAGNITGQGAQIIGGVALGGMGSIAAKALPAVAEAIPAATSALGRLGTASAIGAGYGYLSPYASEGEHVGNTVIGAAAPAAFMGAAKGAQVVGRGVKAVAQRFTNPGAAADSIVARRLADDPNAAAAIANYTPSVPGERPTLAQVVQSPQAVQLERMARSNPVSGPELVAQDNANNVARMNMLRRHLGMEQVASTPSGAPIDAMQAAKMARGTNFGNYMDRFGGRLVDASSVYPDLERLATSGNGIVKRAASSLLSGIKDKSALDGGSGNYLTVQSLDDMRQNIGSAIRDAAQGDKSGGAQARLLLKPVETKIGDAIDYVAPGYKNAVQSYAEQSVPVNTAQQFRKFLDEDATRSLNASGDREATASKVAAFLNRANKSEFGISPQARADTKAVQKSLLDRSVADQKIGAAGSNTDADAQNRFAAAAARHAGAVAGGTLGSWLGPLGTLGGLGIGHGADYLNGIANQRIAAAIGDRVMNPALARQAFVNRLGLLGRRQATNNLLLGVSPYVGIGADTLQRLNAPVGVNQQ